MTRRALILVPIVLLAFILALAAQSQSAPSSTPQDANAAPPDANATKPDQKQKNENADAAVFDEGAAAAVLARIRDGLESHSQRRLLSAFDGDKMDDFLTFQDQIYAYFTRYQSFRVTLHILQISEENHRGVILADFQVENEARGGGPISRSQAQLRFEVERGPKGWKIIDFNPREFFE